MPSPRLWPILSSHLDLVQTREYLELAPLWRTPGTGPGLDLEEFGHSACLQVRISGIRKSLGRPVTLCFPVAEDFPPRIAVHDSNDVYEIHRSCLARYKGSPPRDITRATALARRILDQDDDREMLFYLIAEECSLQEPPLHGSSGHGNFLRVYGAPDLAGFLPDHDSLQSRITSLPRVSLIEYYTGHPARKLLPEAHPDDRVLMLAAPGLVGLSNHARLGRLTLLPRQADLIARAMELDKLLEIQPLTL